MLLDIFYFAEEVDNVVRELKSADVQKPSPVSKYCQCVKYDCGCCVRFSLKELKLINATG